MPQSLRKGSVFKKGTLMFFFLFFFFQALKLWEEKHFKRLRSQWAPCLLSSRRVPLRLPRNIFGTSSPTTTTTFTSSIPSDRHGESRTCTSQPWPTASLA